MESAARSQREPALNLQPAPLGRRSFAFAIDVLLGLPLTIAAAYAADRFLAAALTTWTAGMPTLWWETMVSVAGVSIVLLAVMCFAVLAATVLVLSLVYFPLLEAIWGTTIGKKLVGLCVVRENGTRIGLGAAFLRRIPCYVALFWLDAVFALFSPRRQRAFDRVAKTIVVRCP